MVICTRGHCLFSQFNLFLRSKYFRGKRIHGDYDIRVEQAEFSELSVVAQPLHELPGGSYVTVSMTVIRNGTRVSRSFRPDLILVRQNSRDANVDHKGLVLGLMYGNLPAINSLQAVYNFQVKCYSFFSLSLFFFF